MQIFLPAEPNRFQVRCALVALADQLHAHPTPPNVAVALVLSSLNLALAGGLEAELARHVAAWIDAQPSLRDPERN